MKTKIFYDFEATSVSRDADMISVGLTAVTTYDSVNMLGESGGSIKTFYAEFTDFSLDKCADWVKENVVGKLSTLGKSFIGKELQYNNREKDNYITIGKTESISNELKEWLSKFEEIEFWADFDVIDKPVLIDLIADWNIEEIEEEYNAVYLTGTGEYGRGGIWKMVKTGLPEHLPNIRYDQFFDLHTLFKIKGIDTGISREEFSGVREQVIPLPFSDYSEAHNALYDSWICYLCYNKLINI